MTIFVFTSSLTLTLQDIQLWNKANKHLPLPVCDLGRLVVNKTHRKKGIANILNVIRIKKARFLHAKSIMVTASDGNSNLLKKLGFEEIGQKITFEDRPNTIFNALQLNL